jgi:hypothetical protein
LVGPLQERLRDGQPKGSGSLEVDDQFKRSCLLNREIRWARTLENPPRVSPAGGRGVGCTSGVAPTWKDRLTDDRQHGGGEYHSVDLLHDCPPACPRLTISEL